MSTKQNILLVEDNPADARLIELALAEAVPTAVVFHVSDGVEAVEYLDNKPRPGLVMMDINMPRMNGLECLRRLRNDTRFKMLPVVMLTTSDSSKDIEEAYASGANSYVTKPVTLDDMIGAFKAADEWWFHTVSLPKGV